MYEYKGDFFDFVDQSSGRSASRFLARFIEGIHPASVLDVGCGRGVWLAAWRELGVTDVKGVDGDYVDTNKLKIPKEEFDARDISKPFDLERQFDLVECLEVAEHIPEEKSSQLLQNLIKHGKTILFSAAIPGQGGEFHVNEQPLEYWRTRFAQEGYVPFDFPRERVKGIDAIEPWYRYNTILFVHKSIIDKLPTQVSAHRIADNQNIKQFANASWRIRCFFLSLLPEAAIHRLARLKHRAMTTK